MTQAPINIVKPQAAGEHRLHLAFDDGKEQIVDFLPFLSRSQHPEIPQWLNPAGFSSFRLEYGELVWRDWGLCFPIMDLYRNDLLLQHPLDTAA